MDYAAGIVGGIGSVGPDLLKGKEFEWVKNVEWKKGGEIHKWALGVEHFGHSDYLAQAVFIEKIFSKTLAQRATSRYHGRMAR